jgi:MarR family transcriptional regulator, organic hydroperoxide resistance regulator
MGDSSARQRVAPAGKVRALADAKRRADPAFADFQLADSPLYLIVRTAGRYSMDMEDGLRAVGMDLPSWRALMVLHGASPRSVKEIAQISVTRLSTMTRVIQRLEKQNMVTLSRRESDARVTEVAITSRGEQAARKGRAVASRIFGQVFQDFPAQDIATLNQLLRRVYGRLDGEEHEHTTNTRGDT